MISQVNLIGYKSFLDNSLKLGNLNILTGINSSGKSSIIQALLMIEKSIKGNDFLLDGHGGFNELVNRNYKGKVSIEAIINESNRFSLEFPREKENHKMAVNDNLFPEVIYIAASRFGPKSSIPVWNNEFMKNKIGHNGENVLQSISSHETTIIPSIVRHENSQGDTLPFNVRGWLSSIAPNFDFDYKVDTKSDTSYSTFDGFRSSNVGFGFSYTLPVITALLIGTTLQNSIVIIENPEAHLHPRGQTEIARLISLCSLAGAQIIIETHSEHIIDGIRISAKKNKGVSENTRTFWFELNKERNTDVSEIFLDENGRFDNWPAGFFDQFEINGASLI